MVTIEKYKIPIYDYRLQIIIYDNFKEIIGLLPPEERSTPGSATLAMRGSSITIINAKNFSDISHESEHIKDNIWNYIGYKAQQNNDEVDTYLIGYIADLITEVFCQHKGTSYSNRVCEVGGFNT